MEGAVTMETIFRTEERGFRHAFWWIGLGFFAVCAIAAASSGERGAAVVLGVFALACGLGLAARTTVELDGKALVVRTWLGIHCMTWDEVERVETDGVCLVLVGAGKQLPLAPAAWAKSSGAAARTFLERELETRGVPRNFNPRASRMVCRGTKAQNVRS
ncbi:MAG TPA: hypothetical protein VLT81_03650 [Chondromyces sp.]|nr:hypothetical protein [Chondromyces sp.]